MSYILLCLGLLIVISKVFNIRFNFPYIEPVTPLDRAAAMIVLHLTVIALFIGAATCRYFGW